MFSAKSSMRRLFSSLAVTSCVLTGFSAMSLAQSNPGLTIFSGVRRADQLSYHLDFGGRASGWDRYRLRVPGNKMELGAAQFTISYPDYYDGKFDTDAIEVRVKGQSLPLSEVEWDKENHLIQIYMEEPVPAGSKVEIVLSNVKNPPFGGTYYFEARMLTPGDIPLPRYLGTWILSIN
ncbi:MAG: DUF2808 domain-containing protein [Coleofasciculus sp. S288]|nr:DUF2808 domain-containing protein [Coleofasciculus sp. S288]